VRTPFGWHIIEVQERRTQDITKEKAREQARQALRQRKSDEAFQDWVRQYARSLLRRDPRRRSFSAARAQPSGSVG
jgi:parvulin-like peptidyl-prolyl isomerase